MNSTTDPAGGASRRRRAPLTIAVGVVLLLAGCVGSPSPSPSPSASAASLLGVTCSELVPVPVVDALHPNMKLNPHYKPMEGTYPAKIAKLGGLACEWRAPDGVALEVAAAKLDKKTLAANEARVAAGSTVTLVFGEAPEIRGYYANSGGTVTGDLEVFTETGYWLSAVSPLFFTASDAEAVVASMLQALPSG